MSDMRLIYRSSEFLKFNMLTIITEDDTASRQQLLVQDGLHIGRVAILISVHEDQVEFSSQLLEPVVQQRPPCQWS